MTEYIGAVLRDQLPGALPEPKGFEPDPDRQWYHGLVEQCEFKPREPLETDPSYKQLIPYVVVADGTQILTLRRKAKQSEQRLHDKVSIGIGGHLESVDRGASDCADLLEAGARREFHEELHCPSGLELQYRGILNDDQSDVGRVHLGLVYSARVRRRDVSIREVEKMEGKWLGYEQLHEKRDAMETWSSLLLGPIETWLQDG